MEKFFAFTPLSASFKRTVSMVLWSLSILFEVNQRRTIN